MKTIRALTAGLAACVVLVVGCGKPAPPPPAAPTEVRAARAAKLPTTPDDAAWGPAAVYVAQLRPQDMVEPRKMAAGTAEVRVQALTDGQSIAFRLSWKDATADTEKVTAGFSDACAVQLPAAVSANTPAPQMGEAGGEVEISAWSAAAQAVVDGRAVEMKALFPNAQFDHYPFEAAPLDKDPTAKEEMRLRYAPALALGNQVAPNRPRAVQDLIGAGPGTLRPAPAPMADGKGKRAQDGWAVVIWRPLPRGAALGTRTQVAFAVWNGSDGDTASRKMWAPWTPLVVGEGPVAR